MVKDTYDWDAECDEFQKIVPQLSFPSDDITWGALRKANPKLDKVHSGKLTLEETPFRHVLDYEYQLASNIYICEKHGPAAVNAMHADDTPISAVVSNDVDSVRERYKAANMYSGENSFKEQIKRIEDSVKACLKTKGKG